MSFSSMLMINLIGTGEKSENDGGKNSLTAIKDKPKHLDHNST